MTGNWGFSWAAAAAAATAAIAAAIGRTGGTTATVAGVKFRIDVEDVPVEKVPLEQTVKTVSGSVTHTDFPEIVVA